MTSHLRFLSVVLFIGFAGAVVAALPDPTGMSDADFAYYDDLNGMRANRAFCFALRQLPVEKQALWIERVKSYLSRHGNFSEPPFGLIMLSAGDPETRARHARRFSQSHHGIENWETLAAGDPAVAALVGDDMLGENQDPNPGGDVVFFGRASKTWELMRMTLRVAPEFSDPVKKWARAVPSGLHGEGEDLTIIRDWWRANQAAMKAGRYGDVQPGRTLPAWLEGLPDTDPPFMPGQSAAPVIFASPSPETIKMEYADYLEAKRTGRPYPANRAPVSATATNASAPHRRLGYYAVFTTAIVAVIALAVWIHRRSRKRLAKE